MPETLTAKTDQFSSFITEKILVSLDSAMSDPETRKKISAKLIDIKNSHFSDGVTGQMKLGVLNMFMSEDTIAEMVDKYLPNLINSIKESDEVKEKIALSISQYIDGIIKKPLFQHADAIGMESLFQPGKDNNNSKEKTTLDSGQFADKITGFINELIRKNSSKTLGEVLEQYNLKNAVTDKINSGFKTDIHEISVFLAKLSTSMRIRNLYSVIPKKLFYSIKIALLNEINKIVEKNTPKMLEAINFPKITEDRINSLDLYEVENLLFSFMRDSFRWINILGFIIGFIFGAVQVGIIYFM